MSIEPTIREGTTIIGPFFRFAFLPCDRFRESRSSFARLRYLPVKKTEINRATTLPRNIVPSIL